MHGNKISSTIKSIKSKSNKGSVLSKSNASLLDNYDADAIKEESQEASPTLPNTESDTKNRMHDSAHKLNGTSDATSPLIASSAKKQQDLEH